MFESIGLCVCLLSLLRNKRNMGQINLLVSFAYTLIRKVNTWSERARDTGKRRTKIYDSAEATLKPGPLNEHTLTEIEVCWTPPNGNVAISIYCTHISVCVVECHVIHTQSKIPHSGMQTPLCVFCVDGAS